VDFLLHHFQVFVKKTRVKTHDCSECAENNKKAERRAAMALDRAKPGPGVLPEGKIRGLSAAGRAAGNPGNAPQLNR
jgi:hypothetical protein